MMTDQSDGLFSSWGSVEWALSTCVTVLTGVIAFTWRLAMRVALLEEMLKSAKDERHQLNNQIEGLRVGQEILRKDIRHDIRDALQPVIGAVHEITRRIDKIVDGN